MKTPSLTRLITSTFALAIGGAALTMGLVAPVAAQEPSTAPTATPSQRFEQRVDRRERHQQHRIAQGIESGQLNAREAARLEHQQARVARQEGRMEADGKITRHEARTMEHHQDRASRHIHRQKHDGQTAH